MIAIGLSVIIAAAILALPLFLLAVIGRRIVAGIDELNAALDRETASVAALAAAIGTIQQPIDLQPSVDRVNALTGQIDGLTVALGGSPPPAP